MDMGQFQYVIQHTAVVLISVIWHPTILITLVTNFMDPLYLIIHMVFELEQITILHDFLDLGLVSISHCMV
jgi:hypothetical protein